MDTIRRIKNKYIFYNDNGEVLILKSGINRFFIPGLIEEQYLDSYGEIIKNIIDILIDESKLIELGTRVERFKIFRARNYKLIKTILEEEKHYFSCHCDFKKEFCQEFMNLYYKEESVPILIPIDDLIEMIRYKRFNNIEIDKYLIDPLEELDKRLKFKKY